MESYFEAPFSSMGSASSLHDGPGQSHQQQRHDSLKDSDAPLSPLTLSRLQASWNSNQQPNEAKAGANDGSDSAGSSPSHGQLGSLSEDFDSDFGLFPIPSSHAADRADLEDSYLLGRNSLGLLDDNVLHMSSLQSANTASAAMNHSQSASGILDSASFTSPHRGSDASPMGMRRQGTSNPTGHMDPSVSPFGSKFPQRSASISSPSYLNNRTGSISEHVISSMQHPSRHDFSIGQSPKSAYAIAAAGAGPNTPLRGPSATQFGSPFDAGNHEGLLSLSQTRPSSMGSSTMMGPPAARGPAMNLAKRGLFQGGENDGDTSTAAEGEPTPLASSAGTFAGQRHALGQMANAPTTPFSSRQAFQQSTPGSSISNTTTPDEAGRGWFSSPFTPATAPGSERPGMQRMHSVDGNMHGQHMPLSMQSFNQPLDAFWSDKDDTASQQQSEQRSGLGLSGNQGPEGLSGGLSLFHRRAQQHAMSRVPSAPALAPLSISTGQIHSSVPSTPSDCPPGSAISWASSIPSTPGDVTLSLSPGFGATGMTHSRSMGGMPTNMSPINVSSLSLQDSSPYATPGRGSYSDMSGSPIQNKTFNKGRSNSKSTGTTPRKTGGRATGQAPPLVVSSADKVHVCHCGKRFKRMEHLKRHNRTHTQERPHKCPVEGCGKYFGRTDNLAQHLKTHFRATGLARASQQLFAMSNSQAAEQLDLRHDPHAAAAQAAAAAMQAVKGKRRSSTFSHSGAGDDATEILGGPISLTKQGHGSSPDRSVLTASASANTSPMGAYTLSNPYPM